MGDIKFSIDTDLVAALKSALPFEIFVETGTFEGDAIRLARPYFDVIHSIELSPEYYQIAKGKFGRDPGVHLYLGDSAKMLGDLRPVFTGKSALFWLDAHWCVAQDTGGEKSQCPLLDEIRAIGQLNGDSAILIDDARLFTSPPPQPHEISQWPRLDQVIDALRGASHDHELKIFNDVIVFAPRKANAPLTEYMTRNTVSLLKIKDRADGYYVLDAQLKEKHAEIIDLKRAAVEKDQEIDDLKKATDEKDAEVADLKRETDIKDGEIADIKKAAEERKAEMEAIKAELEAECADKDKEIDDLKGESNTKDTEIAGLKDVCNEREALIITLDGHVKTFQKMVADLHVSHAAKDAELERRQAELARLAEALRLVQADRAALQAATEAKLSRLEHIESLAATSPDDPRHLARLVEDKEVHIQNLEALRRTQERATQEVRNALADREASLAQLAGGHVQLELAKFYGRQLAAKEQVIQELKRACDEREALIQRLCLEATTVGAKLGKLATGAAAFWRHKVARPFSQWLFHQVVERHWMQIGILRQYEPKPIRWDTFPKARLPVHRLPRVGIVTPSFNQQAFIESTMLSVLNQNYPKLRYAVFDGASTDASPAIIARYADRLTHWESTPDRGQGDAIVRGFSHLTDLEPDDVMGWLNSDDFINPKALRFVAEYFATHPEADVIYGNRIIIDENDQEIGRWLMPPHDDRVLDWIDYVPQETLFWRKRAWDRAGGIDPTFQFALDWDLLLRFRVAGLRIVRLPYFLGCFRVHPHQKTSQHIHSIGSDEMTKIRNRIHPRGIDPEMIHHYARKIRFQGALRSRLASLKIRA
jgi:glycosyltransferase involved in cell wall biosynthesis